MLNKILHPLLYQPPFHCPVVHVSSGYHIVQGRLREHFCYQTVLLASVVLEQWSANFLCKEPNNKYFSQYRTHEIFIVYSFFLFCFLSCPCIFFNNNPLKMQKPCKSRLQPVVCQPLLCRIMNDLEKLENSYVDILQPFYRRTLI